MDYISRSYTKLVENDFYSAFPFLSIHNRLSDICDYYFKNKDSFEVWPKAVFETYLLVNDIKYERNGIFRFVTQRNNYYDAKIRKTLRQINLEAEAANALNKIPNGWKKIKGASSHPFGCIWISNGKSRFAYNEGGSRAYKYTLLIDNKELYKEWMRKIGKGKNKSLQNVFE